MKTSNTQTQLLLKIQQFFNLSELQTLCFNLKIDFEDISGSTKTDKIRELIKHCQRQNLLEELLTACEESRPQIIWRTHPQTSLATQPSTEKFIQNLTEELVTTYYYQVTPETYNNKFSWLGINKSIDQINLLAFFTTPSLTTQDIKQSCEELFAISRQLPSKVNIKTRLRNPIGLLCFVSDLKQNKSEVDFIVQQNKISHKANDGAITICWNINLKTKEITTHNKLVSLFPPVIIGDNAVPPGLSFVTNFLQNYSIPS